MLCRSAKTSKHIYNKWSSTEYNNNNAWNYNFNNGNSNNNNKNNTYRVRAVRASSNKTIFARVSFIAKLLLFYRHCKQSEAICQMNKQLSIFDPPPKPRIQLEEVFEAYFECRKNKRNTTNALAFEIDYENNLVQLCDDINNGIYKIGHSIAFIVNKPV